MNITAENAAKYGIAAAKKWWSDARELVASFDRVALENAIVAWIKLNRREEVAATAPSIDFYHRLMSEAFLSLYDAQTVNPEFPITSLGQNFIDQARRETGIGAQSVPAPAPVLTPAQELENEVRSDWKTLSSKQIKSKMQNNRLYRECVERVAGELESTVTQHVTIPGA
jgi:hypothetical protein